MTITRIILMVAAALAMWSGNPTNAWGQTPPRPVLLAELIANTDQAEGHIARILGERCAGLYTADAKMIGEDTDVRATLFKEKVEIATLWFRVAESGEQMMGASDENATALALDGMKRATNMYIDIANENYVRTGSHLAGNTLYEKDIEFCEATLVEWLEKQGT